MMMALAVLALFVVWQFGIWLGHWLAVPTVARIGYVEGIPAAVNCTCGTPCQRSARYKYQSEIWSEWICPNCVTNVPERARLGETNPRRGINEGIKGRNTSPVGGPIGRDNIIS